MTGRRTARCASVPAPPDRARDLILTLLAVAAGCVDAVSFLGLEQVLTAAMTGNTVLLGLALGQAEVQAALRSTVALSGFFAGTLLGASIVERSRGPIWSPAVAAALAIEFALLVALAITWRLADGHRWIDDRFALIAAAGLAMGLQSAVAHRAGVAGIATTYVTGTLTTLAARLVGALRKRALVMLGSRRQRRPGFRRSCGSLTVLAPWLRALRTVGGHRSPWFSASTVTCDGRPQHSCSRS